MTVNSAEAQPAAKPEPSTAHEWKNETPGFGPIGGADKESSLSAVCFQNFTETGSVTCKFTQLRVRHALTKAEADRKFDELKVAVSTAKPADMNAFKLLACGGSIKKAMSGALMDIALSLWKQYGGALCQCMSAPKGNGQTSRDCLVSALSEYFNRRSKTCHVSDQTFEKTFTRAGVNKWISNPGPQGLCDSVTVTLLERDPKQTYRWKFTQTRLDKDTNSKLEPCEALELNKPLIYSSEYPAGADIECDGVEFVP